MSTGPEHYAEAEALIRYADSLQHEEATVSLGGVLAAAQVHATLALAAATALGAQDSTGTPLVPAQPGRDWRDGWAEALS